jgi:low temperature requirement protein LtrA
MTSPAQSVQRDAVSPLELFFDLVFIFAVWQLSHHLLVVTGGLSLGDLGPHRRISMSSTHASSTATTRHNTTPGTNQ